ncbi:MAG: hypothetical protein F6K34_23300, partial [Okeania sp. SIO4D6]|nr:hypothetical protein [Okeania sp. SIO4D6]
MEDYQAAFLERYSDTEILDKSGIKIGAMHFGGVTIECLLKAMIFATLPNSATREWKTDNNNPGHTFTNPGHSYTEALKRHNKLKSRIDKFPQVRKWLDEIENPMCQHFIDIRYFAIEANNVNYKNCFNTYQK